MKSIKAVVMGLALVALAGCALTEQAFDGARERVREADDTALELAEIGLCDAPRVAAVRRRYADSPYMMQAWRIFCAARLASGATQPIVPVPPPPEPADPST